MAEKNEVVVAVGAVIKDKALSTAKKALAPGEYSVEVLARSKGSFKKGEDSTMVVSDKFTVDWKLLAACFANKLNKETRKAVVEDFLKAMDKPEELAELTDEIKVNVERSIGKVKNAAERVVPVAGKVTTDLVFDLVGDPTVTFTAKV